MPAAKGRGHIVIYTYLMRTGMHAWGLLAAAGVAAASVFLYMQLPGAAPAATQGAGPPTVFAASDQLYVAQNRPALPQEQEAAVQALAAVGEGSGAPTNLMAEEHVGPKDEEPLTSAQQTVLGQELQVATAAVAGLDTLAEASAMGYTQSSAEIEGVGAHWVNWTLIDKPFDPARPSMLLFATIGGVQRLVGYSYFVRADQEPAGFAGPNDIWHRHNSICILNGWRVFENRPKEDCPGDWLSGGDLWMLHAWVVPDFKNPWGTFGMMNPLVCPDGRQLECELAAKAPVPDTEHTHE